MAIAIFDPALVTVQKALASVPEWIERNADILDFVVPLEAESVVLEGLSLRGRTRKSLADREVVFQLEFHHPQIVGGAICRIEWKPLSSHSNKGNGPKELRHILQSGSHHHRFDLNWEHSPADVQRGSLPIAVPILPCPKNFRELVALVQKEFNIKGLQSIAIPPWQPTLI